MTHPVICVRCGAQGHPDAPHVCADVARRHMRRLKQADAVEGVLAAYGVAISRQAVEDVVAVLARMGVEQDT